MQECDVIWGGYVFGAAGIADVQIRNRGTIGGSIAVLDAQLSACIVENLAHIL